MNKKILSFTTISVLVFSFLVSFHQANALTLTPIRFSISGDPGQTLVEQITLINEKDKDNTFYPSFANFEAEGESGTPVFKEGTEGLSTWITAPKSVDLPAGTSKTISVEIKIPQTAAPGGYFAAAFFGDVPPNSAGGGEVSISTKIGTLILLRVNGDIKEQANILEFDTLNSQHFFTALPVGMFYRLQNGGGDRARPKGDVSIRNIFGIKAASIDANTVQGNVLPSQIRKFSIAWAKQNTNLDEKIPSGFFSQVKYQWHNFAFGRFSANLAVTYGSTNAELQAKTTFWVLPWQLLIVIIILGILGLFILMTLIKSYNRFIIQKAKESISQNMGGGASGN